MRERERETTDLQSHLRRQTVRIESLGPGAVPASTDPTIILDRALRAAAGSCRSASRLAMPSAAARAVAFALPSLPALASVLAMMELCPEMPVLVERGQTERRRRRRRRAPVRYRLLLIRPEPGRLLLLLLLRPRPRPAVTFWGRILRCRQVNSRALKGSTPRTWRSKRLSCPGSTCTLQGQCQGRLRPGRCPACRRRCHWLMMTMMMMKKKSSMTVPTSPLAAVRAASPSSKLLWIPDGLQWLLLRRLSRLGSRPEMDQVSQY